MPRLSLSNVQLSEIKARLEADSLLRIVMNNIGKVHFLKVFEGLYNLYVLLVCTLM